MTALNAWAAGFWEGEGWVQVWRHKKSPVHPRIYVYLTACASQKDPEMLYRLKEIFGGHVHRSSKKQEIWRWSLHGAKAEQFFDTIWPLLSARRREQITEKRRIAAEEVAT